MRTTPLEPCSGQISSFRVHCQSAWTFLWSWYLNRWPATESERVVLVLDVWAVRHGATIYEPRRSIIGRKVMPMISLAAAHVQAGARCSAIDMHCSLVSDCGYAKDAVTCRGRMYPGQRSSDVGDSSLGECKRVVAEESCRD